MRPMNLQTALVRRESRPMGDISEEHEDRFNDICEYCLNVMWRCSCDEDECDTKGEQTDG